AKRCRKRHLTPAAASFPLPRVLRSNSDYRSDPLQLRQENQDGRARIAAGSLLPAYPGTALRPECLGDRPWYRSTPVQASRESRHSQIIRPRWERAFFSPPRMRSAAIAFRQRPLHHHGFHAPRWLPLARPECKDEPHYDQPTSSRLLRMLLSHVTWEIRVFRFAPEQALAGGKSAILGGHKLIADLRTSPIEANGSRAPSLGAIHFFSLPIMSSSSFLSSADGM